MENRETLTSKSTWPKGFSPILENGQVVELRIATRDGVFVVRGAWDKVFVSKILPMEPVVELETPGKDDIL